MDNTTDRLSTATAQYEALSTRRTFTKAVLSRGLAMAENRSYDDVLREHVGVHNPHWSRLERSRLEKSATSAMLSTDAGLDYIEPLRAAWADLPRKLTILGRTIGTRPVPAALPITTVSSGTVAGFVTEGAPVPVYRPTMTDATLMPGRIAAIAPYSRELMRASMDRAAILIERDLSRAAALGEDGALLDGAAAVSGGRPASILNGIAALTGESPQDLEGDVLALLSTVRGGDLVAPYFATSPAGALALIGARTNGQRLFPNVVYNGGTILGVPLLVSSGAPDILALFDADAIHVVDQGVDVDIARVGAFQFDTAPTDGAAATVSLFQTNAIGVRIQRWIGWRLADATAAGYITLQTGSPA